MKEGMFNKLLEEVIEPGFCVLCGACSGFCDRITLDYAAGLPVLVKPCVLGCTNCYDQCPMRMDFDSVQVFGKTERDAVLGPYIEISAVKAAKEEMRERSQDGGAVTAILSAILERGKIDAAVVVERDATWRPLPRIVTSKEELLTSRGSKYSPSPNIATLGEVFRKAEIKSIAVVDVGCHIRGIRNLEYNLLYNAGFSPYSDLKIYTIGLFCSGSFQHNRLVSLLDSKPGAVKKMDVKGGRFIAVSDKVETHPIKAFEDAFMPSCPVCSDYTAELADLSVGSIGSPEGYSTVIVRNLMGWGMLRDAVQRGFAESDPSLVDIAILKKAVEKKKEKVRGKIASENSKGRPIPGFIKI